MPAVVSPDYLHTDESASGHAGKRSWCRGLWDELGLDIETDEIDPNDDGKTCGNDGPVR